MAFAYIFASCGSKLSSPLVLKGLVVYFLMVSASLRKKALSFWKTKRPLAWSQKNPKRQGTLAAARYDRYKVAKTALEAHLLGCSFQDLEHDLRRGFVASNCPVLTVPSAQEREQPPPLPEQSCEKNGQELDSGSGCGLAPISNSPISAAPSPHGQQQARPLAEQASTKETFANQELPQAMPGQTSEEKELTHAVLDMTEHGMFSAHSIATFCKHVPGSLNQCFRLEPGTLAHEVLRLGDLSLAGESLNLSATLRLYSTAISFADKVSTDAKIADDAKKTSLAAGCLWVASCFEGGMVDEFCARRPQQGKLEMEKFIASKLSTQIDRGSLNSIACHILQTIGGGNVHRNCK
eukprot:12400613-Karenia_brevis.AAC.1